MGVMVQGTGKLLLHILILEWVHEFMEVILRGYSSEIQK